jgi:hypothetical protein
MVKLPYVHSPRDRHGKQRHYFRKPGVKRVPLPGLPGSAEFNRAYEAALAGETTPLVEVGVSRSKPGSVAMAVANYYQSIPFGNLTPETQRHRRRILDRFRDEWGENRLDTLSPQRVAQFVADKIATPHTARHFSTPCAR